MSAPQATAFWRVAGLNYLQFSQISAQAVRNVLKEPLRAAAAARSDVHLRERSWKDGKAGDRFPVDNLFDTPLLAKAKEA